MEQRVGELLEACKRRRLRLATAESCTGGGMAAAITSHPGSSVVFVGSAVVYADEAKTAMLAVAAELLQKFGAVSREVALAMADGVVDKLDADLGLAITGIAGPDNEDGESGGKPIGLVHIAAARKGRAPGRDPGQTPLHQRWQFDGGRAAVRLQSCLKAAELGLELL